MTMTHRTRHGGINGWSNITNGRTQSKERMPLRSCAAFFLSFVTMSCLLLPVSIKTGIRDLRTVPQTSLATVSTVTTTPQESKSSNATKSETSSGPSHYVTMTQLPERLNETVSPSYTVSSQQQPQVPRIPSVLLAGSQKAGTTSLAKYLMRTSNLCFSNDGISGENSGKEAHFFDTMYYNQGLSKYQQLFQNCSDNDILFDGTPEIMLFPERVREIYDEQGTTKNVKIIFILREPVSREISWYNHLMRYVKVPVNQRPDWTSKGFNADGSPKDFIQFERDTAIRFFLEPDRGVSRGNYVYWLQRWFELFDRPTQILILSYDELLHDTKTTLVRVHEFLNLSQSIAAKLQHANTKGKGASPISCDDQNEVASYFKVPNALLYPFLESHPGPPMEQTPFPHFDFRCNDKK